MKRFPSTASFSRLLASQIAFACFAIFMLGSAGALCHAADSKLRPNIVFILADDLGYGDLGCYGNTSVKTPNIDRLARDGVRLTQFYSNGPECTPTRTAFMTGRYQHRVGGLECALGTGNVGRYDDAIRLRETHDLGLPTTEPSIARMLKKTGYATTITGKWHLGYEPKFFPGPHGFDYWFGVLGGGADYFHHTEPEGLPVLYEQGRQITREGYVTDLITAAAEKYLKEVIGGPFFLYVPYTAPHTPIQAPDDFTAEPLPADEWNRKDARRYRAMIERMDEGVGKILAALEARGFATNTLVVFSSDNGGTGQARNTPLSGSKGTTFEGGIRVPCLMRWPGVLKPGTVSDQMAITMDLTASFARIGSAAADAGKPFDGIDIIAHLADGKPGVPRQLFWRGRRGDNTWWAARDGSWKYIRRNNGGKVEEHVFDLASDIAEKNDLLTARPEQTAALKTLLQAWEQRVKPSR